METQTLIAQIPFQVDADFFIELGEKLNKERNNYESFLVLYYNLDDLGVFGIKEETEQEAEARKQHLENSLREDPDHPGCFKTTIKGWRKI